MRAATQAHAPADIRVLVVDGPTGALRVEQGASLPALLAPGDLVVVNDAATLPASLPARTGSGAFVEVRLTGERACGEGRVCFGAALLGKGDHRTPTEHRPPPPRVVVGERLDLGEGLVARVTEVSAMSERLVDLELGGGDADAIWSALYRVGRPVQYAHVPEPLALWDVQNVWAGRPWAVEMPSAGRVIRASTLAALANRGVGVATITHAAGLSATGDPRIDARLPLPERFEVPEATARAVRETRARGGRVVAVGTSVVRALESAALRSGDGGLEAASGVTDLLLGMASRLRVTDAIVTGVHEVDTSHFTLLGAFARAPVLAAALEAAERADLKGHELGDAWLVWRDPSIAGRAAARAA